jgi:membrane-associated phospholipid phosphatase
METTTTPDIVLDDTPAAEQDGRRLSRVMVAILVVYVAFILVLMVVRGAYMSPDLFIVLALVIVVVMGRTRLFLRDWLPFAAIFLGWESMRGLADELGATVHSTDVIALERFFFAGRIPSEVLQAAFHTRGQVNVLDMATTFLYVAHFALPLVVAFTFWAFERGLFYRYLLALMLMSFAAFICYVLIPVAPPRFAGSFGPPLDVEDIALITFSKLHFAPVTTWLYGSISGNPVAAFPSLHSAYPLLAYLFARTRWPRASLILLVWAAAIWFSVVYLGHHYVIDVVAGIAFAIGAYAALQSPTLKRFAAWLASLGAKDRSLPADQPAA